MYSQILPNISLSAGNIPAVPIGGQFQYLGRLFDVSLDDACAKSNIVSKMDNFLKIISNLKIKPQTKLRIFSQFLPSQFSFELRIYNFSSTWISENIDALCIRIIRSWIKAPISSCVKEWLITPSINCRMGIPSIQCRAERLKLQKRNALKCSR